MIRTVLLCLILMPLGPGAWARKDISYRPFSGAHSDGSDFSYWLYYADKPDAWFATEEARRIADNVLSYQLPHGGWSKQIDMISAPHRPGAPQSHYRGGQGGFDNEATTAQMRFLARAYKATGDHRYRDAFLRGVDYLLHAQYPSGGWPQVYPLSGTFQRCVTFNDYAMTSVMELLRDVLRSRGFEFVDARRCKALNAAFEKGLDYILKSQIQVNGRLTAWCQQHDPVTYEPRPARAYEHVSLTSAESAGILLVLVSLRHKTPAIERAIQAGAAWLREARIDGYRQGKLNGLRALVPDPSGHVWARFYEIGTNRPIFSDYDGAIRYSIEEISAERRNGYGWYSNLPDRLLRLLGDVGGSRSASWSFGDLGHSQRWGET